MRDKISTLFYSNKEYRQYENLKTNIKPMSYMKKSEVESMISKSKENPFKGYYVDYASLEDQAKNLNII
jgi:hypothetical protein